MRDLDKNREDIALRVVYPTVESDRKLFCIYRMYGVSPAGHMVRLFRLYLANHVKTHIRKLFGFRSRFLFAVFCDIRNSQFPKQRNICGWMKLRHWEQFRHVSASGFLSEFFNQRAGFFQRSEEHTSELQSRFDLVCRLLL